VIAPMKGIPGIPSHAATQRKINVLGKRGGVSRRKKKKIIKSQKWGSGKEKKVDSRIRDGEKLKFLKKGMSNIITVHFGDEKTT